MTEFETNQPNRNGRIPLIQVVNWATTFEKLNSPVLDIADSPRLLGVMGQLDGPAIWGIFMLVVDLCRRHAAPCDGWLTLNGTTIGERYSLECLTRLYCRAQLEVLRCVQVVTSRHVGFMRFVEGDFGQLYKAFLNRDRRRWA